MKSEPGRATNILSWLDWVTFKFQRTLQNIALAIKASVRVNNRAQYANHQMNNTVKNQTYPKKFECIFLDRLFDTILETIRYSKRLVSLGFQYHCILLEITILNLS